MFRAISRYVRAFFALITGGLDSMRQTLNENKHVISATYDEIIEDQRKRVVSMSDAIGGMIQSEQRKVNKIEELSKRMGENEELRDGAVAMIEELKKDYDLNTEEGIEALKSSSEYIEASTAYESLTKDIDDDQSTITELEEALAEDRVQLSNYKSQLGTMKDQIDKIKSEKHETIAQVEASKQEREVNDLINNISRDTSSDRLREMRETRDRVKSQAKVSRELAGTETNSRREKFKNFARKRKSASEFDKLLGLGKETSSKEGASKEEEKTAQLPE